MPKFKFPKLKLMPKLNAKTHITMGLAFLVVTLLLAAVSLQLVPDRIAAIRESRATLSETIAINASAFIIKNEYKVLKLILGAGDPLIGRLLVYDALAMEFREFKIPKDPDCLVCGPSPTITEPIDYEAFCAAAATEEDASAIPELAPVSLKARLEAGEDLLLIDVREPFEAELAHIDGARLIPLGQIEGAFGELEDWRERPVVLHCHTGVRSRQACQLLISKGFSQIENLQGGIDAWSREVDPTVPRY